MPAKIQVIYYCTELAIFSLVVVIAISSTARDGQAELTWVA